jgi:hypothetical protein
MYLRFEIASLRFCNTRTHFSLYNNVIIQLHMQDNQRLGWKHCQDNQSRHPNEDNIPMCLLTKSPQSELIHHCEINCWIQEV